MWPLRALLLAVAATAAVAAAAARAQTPAPEPAAVTTDPVDTAGGFDITRVKLGRAADGRLRAAITLAAPWRMRDLPADSGPPGSLCLRLWTRTEPKSTFPDDLVCVTADAEGRHMTGSVLVERDGDLRRVADVAIARSSTRTVVLRFSQTAVGRPDSIRFAAEATPPGCPRPACVDTAPNAPAVATLTLRER
jgi:hypothetical protein